MGCACGYTDEKVESKISEKIEDHQKIEVVDADLEVLPTTEAECSECGHTVAYYWEVQTRASDEPATKFLKCEKCKHVWRDYS